MSPAEPAARDASLAGVVTVAAPVRRSAVARCPDDDRHPGCRRRQPIDEGRSGRRVALAGIGASAVLAALNVVVGLWSNSTSVVATGVEFAGDILAPAVVVLGMLVAARSADDDHPYGHGRVETIAAFVVA